MPREVLAFGLVRVVDASAAERALVPVERERASITKLPVGRATCGRLTEPAASEATTVDGLPATREGFAATLAGLADALDDCAASAREAEACVSRAAEVAS